MKLIDVLQYLASRFSNGCWLGLKHDKGVARGLVVDGKILAGRIKSYFELVMTC